MPDINDLHKVLEEIKKVLEQSAKAQVGAPGAATKLGAPKSMKDHFAGAFEKAKLSSMKLPGVEKLGGMAGKGSGFGGGMMGGTMGGIFGMTIGIGVELAKLPGKVKEFADRLHEANRAFAQFSPSMAFVMAQSDMRDQFRKMQMGEDIASSAGSLANARGDITDSLAPVDTAFANLSNNFGTLITGAMNEFLEQSEWAQQLADMVEDLSEVVGDIAGWLNLKKEKDERNDWEEEMERMARSDEVKRVERAQPVRQPPARDPRPNFPWDRR